MKPKKRSKLNVCGVFGFNNSNLLKMNPNPSVNTCTWSNFSGILVMDVCLAVISMVLSYIIRIWHYAVTSETYETENNKTTMEQHHMHQRQTTSEYYRNNLISINNHQNGGGYRYQHKDTPYRKRVSDLRQENFAKPKRISPPSSVDPPEIVALETIAQENKGNIHKNESSNSDDTIILQMTDFAKGKLKNKKNPHKTTKLTYE